MQRRLLPLPGILLAPVPAYALFDQMACTFTLVACDMVEMAPT